jgi:hypothetical protein
MPSWKKVITSGSDASLNSLNVISGITGSLQGTASYAETLDGLDSTNFVQTSTAQTITGNKSFRDTTFFGTDSADGKITFVEQTAGLSASISIDSEANLNIQNAEDLILVTIAQNGDGISLASGTFTGNLTGNADTATTASFASTASFVNTLNQNLTLVGNQIITGSLTVTNNLIVLGSSSLQYMSQSTLNIGTNLITVNTFNPSVRFGGLAVIDSGSSPQSSGSFLYDSVHDEFIFVHRGDGTNVTSSHFLVGPQTYNDLGNETYIAANTILKSQGNEHVIASNITDNGSFVTLNSNTAITGSLYVSSSNSNNVSLLVGTSSLFISSSGHVGIGTLNTPASLNVSVRNGFSLLALTGNNANVSTLFVGQNGNLHAGWTHTLYNGFCFDYSGNPFIGNAGGNYDFLYQRTNRRFGFFKTTPSVAVDIVGTVYVTGSLAVSAAIAATNVTSSFARISGSGNLQQTGPTLAVYGSGSGYPVFTVQGSQGELFSVSDSLTGSLFSVSDISGLPILEVFSDDTIVMGDYQAPSLFTTKRHTSTVGVNNIYSIPTSSYNGAFFDYVVTSASNARAGNITAIALGTAIQYNETTTMDIGNTSGVNFMVRISGNDMVLTGSFTTANWVMKTIIRSI